MEKKETIFSKEKNSALHGETGERNLRGCMYLIILLIVIIICIAITEPSFFDNL